MFFEHDRLMIDSHEKKKRKEKNSSLRNTIFNDIFSRAKKKFPKKKSETYSIVEYFFVRNLCTIVVFPRDSNITCSR